MKNHTIWTPPEWELVAQEILRHHPLFLNLDWFSISSKELINAMHVLPAHRKRPVAIHGGKDGFVKGLLKAFSLLRAKEFVPKEIETPANTHTRVVLKKHEWDLLVSEIVKQNPHEPFLQSSTLAGLTLRQLRDAQMIFPENRRRPFHSVSIVRPNILSAMARLRANLAAAPANGFDDAPVVAPAAPPGAPLPALAPLDSVAASSNPYEALAPLFDMLAVRVAGLLLPHLRAMMASPADNVPPCAPGAVVAPSFATPGAFVASSARAAPGGVLAAPRRTRIGVVGPLSVQAQNIAASFPQFEFTAVEKSVDNLVEKLRGVDKIIGMTGFMTHNTDGILSKRFGEKYTRVSGGVSSVKRQIEIWLSSGTL